MPQLAVTIDLDGHDADEIEAACFALGALSVVLTDQRDDAILEPAPGEIRLWPATRLQAIFAAEIESETLLVELARITGCPRERYTLSTLEDRAWEREWLKDFKPLRFGTRLWICPTHARVDDPAACVVTLDPGLAFGTGTHPTTRLCLEYLDALPAAALDGTVVDYGCGSGVLAIAALRLGAARALAHDIDPQALIATADNAATNDVAGKIVAFESATDLVAAVAASGGACVVLANILSGPLCELAPRLGPLLAPGGHLVLAGLLEEQADEVIAAYAPHLPLQRWRGLDGWICLAGELR
jgi:ribosomal protein L11 methyltransferase